VLDEDYARGGFRLLPSPGGTDGRSAFLILLYTLFVIPVGLLPWTFGFVGPVAAIVSVVMGLVMLWPALKLFRSHERTDARRLMFASFLYLPIVQVAYVLDRL
jgi:protoheme IX farnesyltransferase